MNIKEKIQYILGEAGGYATAGMLLTYFWVTERWQKILDKIWSK